MGVYDQGADATAGRWLTIPRTLSFVYHADEVLLLKRGDLTRVFPGRYNGLGGHIEPHEDARTSALREIYEESGLPVQDLRFCGALNINAGQATGVMLFVFRAQAAHRQFTPSLEGQLTWVRLEDVGQLPLVEDLPLLLPRVFGPVDRLPFFGHTSYDSQDRLRIHFAEA